MKTYIKIILGLLFSLQTSFAASKYTTCHQSIETHLNIVETSQIELKRLANKKEDITPFEISELQKSLTKRYTSLKKFMTFYEDDASQCGSAIMSKAVAIYDFTVFGQEALTHSSLRKIVVSFTKYQDYGLSDFISSYKKYTSNKYIAKIKKSLQEEEDHLPENVQLESSVRKKFKTMNDRAKNVAGSMVAGFAKFWGFASDHLKWRQGRLKDQEEAYELVHKNLKPLDLVFEKRTFTLSNYTIPGHWGHVAIWLGTKDELQDLGLWDKKFFAPFRQQVLAGKQLLEIRKHGLNYQSLKEYINLDQIAITRVKSALGNAENIFKELTRNINKKYDFQFDSQSLNKITCAELITFSYGNIKWPQTKTLFQSSISPDDLAVVSTHDTGISEFVLYLKSYKDGSFENVNYQDWSRLFKAPKGPSKSK